MPEKKRVVKRKGKTGRRRFRPRFFLFSLLLVALVGGGGFLYYRTQERPAQERMELWTLKALDLARENRHTPHEMRLILDVVADRIPLHVGLTVDPGRFSGDTTHLFGGAPRLNRPVRLLENIGYIAAYDEERGNPAWVAYRAFQPEGWEARERPEAFVPDTRTRARIHPDFYRGSGYDRGHLAPNYAIAILHGDEAQAETFLMSNIIPQSPELNRRVWRDLEQRIIRRYTRRFEEVWIITGPVYGEQRGKLLAGRVEVPEACFKIVLDQHESGLRALAFLIPQNVTGNEDPAQFLTSIREIERRTGLDFLAELDAAVQEAIETVANVRVW